MKGVLFLAVCVLGAATFAAGYQCPSGSNPCYTADKKDNICCPGSCGKTNGNNMTCAVQTNLPDGATPTFRTYVKFDDRNPLENCAGQGGGEGLHFGDKCMYRPHLWNADTDEIIGYATFLVTYVTGYDNPENVEQFVQFTFYISPPGEGDNAAANELNQDSFLTMQGRFRPTGRATRCAITGGVGDYLGASGYTIAIPAGSPSEHVSKFYHYIYLQPSCQKC